MTSPRRCRGLLTSFALAFFFVSVTTTATAQVSAAKYLGVDAGLVPASAPVQITLHLQPSASRLAALDRFLQVVVDPTSASYRQFLTPAEFGARFGAEASQLESVTAFVQAKGLQVSAVSPSGMRVTLAGTDAQVESMFRPVLHTYVVGTDPVAVATATPSIPAGLAANVVATGKVALTDPSTTSAAAAADDLLAALSSAIENSTKQFAAAAGVCVSEVTPEWMAAFALTAKEAVAQGTTLIAPRSCTTGLSFPASLPEVTAVVLADGSGNSAAGADLHTALRPAWQTAVGLPDDGLRASPDVTVSSVDAFAQALSAIAASMPRAADGSVTGLGNVNAALYSLAAAPGLYTQPDGATSGTWEPATGLGLVNVATLAQVYPRGTLGVNVSVNSSNYAPTHGQSITLTSAVSDTSGQGAGAVPSGSVTFTTSGGQTLGAGNLVNGSASVTLNTLTGGTYSVTANYSGDTNYAANHSVAANISVIGEPTALTASVAGSVPVGAQLTVNATAKSTSGVGTPTGTITVQPQGVSNSGTYSGTLSGANGTATTTVTLPATQAGNVSLLISCVSADPSFTCFTPVNVTVVVTQAATTTTLTLAPNPPVAGQTTTFTARVAGAATPSPLPTGNVSFYDNGSLLGTGTLTNGSAAYTNSSLSGTTGHTFTATYVGDANYTSSTSSGTSTTPTQGPTTTTLTIMPNPPVYGTTTTFAATVGYTTIGTFPVGTVTFFQDGSQVGTAAVASNGVATFTSTVISGTSSHVFSAKYNGDSNYAGSTSADVSTQSGSAVATTATLALAPNPPVSGTQTTLTANVAYISNGSSATGTVQFYQDGAVIGSGVLSASGVATYSSSALTSTTVHSFYAKYLGDTNYQPSQSNTVVTQAATATVATTTTISTTATTVTPGATATFMATVTPQSAVNGTAPTGMVTFTSSTQGALGTVALSGNAASLTVALTMAGAQNVTATYSGDSSYKGSTSATPVSVTVGATLQPLTLLLSPATVGFGGSVTAVASVAGATTTNSIGPSGTVVFAVTAVTALGATVAFTPSSTTGANASYTFAAPAPGTYMVTATCTGTNFTCASTAATATLTVSKGATTTTVTALPAVPVAGQPTLLTATVAPAGTTLGGAVPGATAPSGMVTFYVNGVSAGTATLTGGVAVFSTTLNATAANIVSAIYSGDTNYLTSTSTAVTLMTPPTLTTGTLTSNLGTALQGSLVIFTASISVAPTVANPTPGTPGGSLSFYDNYNGQSILLGTASLISSGPYTAVAQLSTTGLFHGVHSITAVFAATTTLAGVTSSALGITITDYAPAFTPGSLTISRGAIGTAILTISPLNGFTGTVVLGCTAPSDTATTCSFNPTALSGGGGSSTLTVGTTAPQAQTTPRAQAAPPASVRLETGISLAALLGFLLSPKRRRPALLALLLLCGLLGASGCGTQLTNTGGAVQATSGTPLGTQTLTIVTSGSDGVTTTRHNLSFQVTVQ